MIQHVVRSAVLILMFVSSLLAQQVEYTKRSKNDVREGPGSYFQLVKVLPRGVPIPIEKREGGWVRFNASNSKDNIAAWLSKNCLIEKQTKDVLRDLKTEWSSAKASPSAVAAAIRGFAERYGNVAAVAGTALSLEPQSFSAAELSEFKMGSRPRADRGKVSDESLTRSEYESNLAEEGIGLGIAVRLASEGLVKNPKLLKYVNLLAATLAEESGAYDIPFKVFVTTLATPRAFSVPGGYVFLSQGLIQLCSDEAELAGVIGHELMHIVLRHGMRETYERRFKVKMDEAMAELEQELAEEPDSTSAELEEFAQEAYETVVKPRLQVYEEEADQAAVVLLAKAGYDPMAVSRMILRVRDAVKAMPPEKLEDSPFAHLDFEKRNEHLLQYMQKYVRATGGLRNVDRFRKWVK